jgi:hypothetical protein
MSRDKTAVEILMDLLTYDNGTGQRWSSYLDCIDLLPYFQKALEIEKEQMEDFFCTGILDSGEDYGLGFNHYYKQTFKINSVKKYIKEFPCNNCQGGGCPTCNGCGYYFQ